MTSTTAQTFSNPCLPPLFFSSIKNAQPVRAGSAEENEVELPSEILHQCLVEYADWGDLARLSCVQKSWSNTMMEAANQSQEAKWELVQALMEGARGLEQNHSVAFRLMTELAKIETDKHNMPVLTDSSQKQEINDDTNNENNDNTQQCFAPAMKAIANCYFDGNGVATNPTAGIAWLRAAHEMANDTGAAHDLALVFEYGRHNVDIDIFAAADWFKKAASEGHIEAMAELALCYELGCGVEQSDSDALDWYMKAANAGHVTSKFSVAECFEEARGVPQSDEEACLWYYKAAVEGDHDSKMALRRLEEIARIVVPGVRAILDV